MFVNSALFANPITINVAEFVDSIYNAEENPNFIEHYETIDKSQFVTFRAKELDYEGAKVVLEKAFNAAYGAFPKYSLIRTDLFCSNQTLKRTFFLFDEEGVLMRQIDQESTVLAMNTNLAKLVCTAE